MKTSYLLTSKLTDEMVEIHADPPATLPSKNRIQPRNILDPVHLSELIKYLKQAQEENGTVIKRDQENPPRGGYLECE